MNYTNLLLILFIVASCSCKNNQGDKKMQDKRQPAKPVYTIRDTGQTVMYYQETDTGDSLVFYKDFDLYSFQGLGRINGAPRTYPFLKMIYKGDTLRMKAYYSKGKTHSVKLFKLNGYWCLHSSAWSDGSTVHSYSVFTPRGLYHYNFRNDPYADTAVSLYGVYVQNRTATGNEMRSYFSFNWRDVELKKIPKANFSEELMLKNCSSMSVIHEQILNDTLYTTNSRRDYKDGVYGDLGAAEINTSQYPAIFGSFFYTHFPHMRDGNIRSAYDANLIYRLINEFLEYDLEK